MRRTAHKREVEAIRKLIEGLAGRCNVLAQSRRLFGSPGLADLYIQIPMSATLLRPPKQEGREERGRKIYKPFRFWVEVKAGRDKLSADQIAFKAQEEQCGGLVIVGGVEEVIAYLKAEGVGIL